MILGNKIKEKILHPHPAVRQMAAQYLADVSLEDETILPVIIRAVKKFGVDANLGVVVKAKHFQQPQESFQWLMQELRQEPKGKNTFIQSYRLHLSAALLQSDCKRLKEYEQDILTLPYLFAPYREAIKHLLSLPDLNFDKSWYQLEKFCDQSKTKDHLSKQEWLMGENLVRHLAEFGDRNNDRVLFLLKKETANDENHPMKWLELLAIELAGNLKIEAAVPLILDKYSEDDDLLCEFSHKALEDIGGDAVVNALVQRLPRQAEGYFAMFAAEILEHIHTDNCFQACLSCMHQEKDLTLKTDFCLSLLAHLRKEGLDAVYSLVQENQWDPDTTDLKEDFVWVCLLTDTKYPELKKWERHARKVFQKREKITFKMKRLFPSVLDDMEEEEEEWPAPAQTPMAVPQDLPRDLRAIEKHMYDIHRLSEDKKFSSVKEANTFFQKLMGKKIPSPTPKDSRQAAQELAYAAFAAEDHPERIRLAQDALKISENCVDAYVILSEETSDSRAAVEYARKGVAIGESLLGEEFFKENKGRFWGIFETRPYMRARMSLAEILWYQGEKDEALFHYGELLQLNPNDNQGVRHVLVGRLIERRAWEAVQKLLDQYPDDCMAEWAYSRVLWSFQKEGPSAETEKQLKKAVECNQYVPDYLLGKKEIPTQTFTRVALGGEDEAAVYAQENGPLWWRDHELMQWVEKVLYPSYPIKHEGPKIGRNDPCPCGSGRKYKKCCGS